MNLHTHTNVTTKVKRIGLIPFPGPKRSENTCNFASTQLVIKDLHVGALLLRIKAYKLNSLTSFILN